ncbi:MAG: signal peptidase II [Oscillospiraceae bacterium]|nr:signal peptidase II [Oscillospiraceae bacterium]
MLIFVFSALVVVLDQFFKRWVVRAIPLHDNMDLIPGVIGLTHLQNTGAAFSILAGQRWLLAAIAFVACLVLVFILLRYTEGFWGTLGLAAVLGGAVGNLIDRIFYGYVIDMFRTLFVNFAIFNIADIFITLGFITFCIHFITASVKQSREEKEALELVGGDDDEDYYETDDEELTEDYPDPYEAFEYASDETVGYDEQAAHVPVNPVLHRVDTEPDFGDLETYIGSSSDHTAYNGAAFEPQVTATVSPIAPAGWQGYYDEPEQLHGETSTLDALSALELELDGVEELDVDAMLREYGFEEDER